MNSSSVQFKSAMQQTRQIAEQQGYRLEDSIVKTLYNEAEKIARLAVRKTGKRFDWDARLDDVLTSRYLGYPIMLILLGLVFWITLVGANYPSRILAAALFGIEGLLTDIFMWFGAPGWFHGIVVLGMYRTFAWVVSVMLPPMAIFFPLFTFMEDLGYLPRVAFNLDSFFKRAGTHGKQALTMSMGFGCNAAGVVASRIIDSPRERLIAVITNNFVPCNGRFPTLITLSTLFMGAGIAGAHSLPLASAFVVSLILVGIAVTLAASWLLSKTILRGIPSTFTLELPPYRRPQIGQIIVRSFMDRTLFVLRKAVAIAVPAGAVVWLFANTHIGGQNLIVFVSSRLDPFARLMGMDGAILLAFILGLPANEIVIPIVIMSYLSAGAMLEFENLHSLKQFLVDHGWTWATALSVMLFSLLHFPCATTLWTIRSETRRWKWVFVTTGITTATAFIVCTVVYQLIRLVSL